MYKHDIIEACAAAAHELNRIYCQANGEPGQVHWEEAPEWQKTSARKGVLGVLIDNNTPEKSHESWLKEKSETGWKYGPVKDPAKKEHPCFVPYKELPAAQKKKDQLFVGSVRAMAEVLGYFELDDEKRSKDAVTL
jgi:RyR domain-containing protein